MIITEILVVLITLTTIHYFYKIVRKLLADETFDIHIFDDLNFTRKIAFEQDTIIHNLMYIISVVLLFVVRIFVPFSTFYWITWFNLYTLVQTYLIVRYNNLSKLDKFVAVVACILYYFIPSPHLDNLILYSTLHMDPIVAMDKALFGRKAYLVQYHKTLLRIDTLFFFIFWPLSFVSFIRNPYVIDVMTIPVSFYYQLYQTNTPLNNKKKV